MKKLPENIIRFDIGPLACCGASAQSGRICYILSFEPLEWKWIYDTSVRLDCNIAVISGMDWDNDLTPWPAPGVPAGSAPFKGRADVFMDFLRSKVVPEVERNLMRHGVEESSLVGISLSGLFALWEWVQDDTFDNIASISGSFWYEGFVEWLQERSIPHKAGRAYFSLGNKESSSPVPQFRPVAVDTAKVIEVLRANGIDARFRQTPGTHYAPVYPRLDMALDELCR